MKKKQVVLLFLIAIGLGIILFFTFAHFKKEEEKMLERASENKRIEELDKKEKEEQEERQKKEEGQKQVNVLLENLQNTKKIILSNYDELGEIESFDSNKYTMIKEITEEKSINEIVNCFASSIWQENKNTDFLGKLWQFYDSENQLILEYEGHAFVTKEKSVVIYLPEDMKNRLNLYFEN